MSLLFSQADDGADDKATGNMFTSHLSLNSLGRYFSVSKKNSMACPNSIDADGNAESSNLLRYNLQQPTASNGPNGKRVQIVTSRVASADDMTAEVSRELSGSVSCRMESKLWRCRVSACLSKFVLFYRAPITSFWIWSISFALFMLLLIYVLLIEFPPEVGWVEWLLFAYVLGLGLEHFRKLLILESSSFMEKMRVFYYNRYWNILTTIAVLTYFVGFALRFNPSTVHTYSRWMLASNSLLWHMKLFDFLSVHPRIGPYITMAGKMVLAMSYIIVMLLVTLMAFGVVRQSITFPHEKWNWILVRWVNWFSVLKVNSSSVNSVMSDARVHVTNYYSN